MSDQYGNEKLDKLLKAGTIGTGVLTTAAALYKAKVCPNFLAIVLFVFAVVLMISLFIDLYLSYNRRLVTLIFALLLLDIALVMSKRCHEEPANQEQVQVREVPFDSPRIPWPNDRDE